MAGRKMKAPDSVSGFTYQGMPIDIYEDGSAIAIDDAMAAAMRSHGFAEYEEDVQNLPATPPVRVSRKPTRQAK